MKQHLRNIPDSELQAFMSFCDQNNKLKISFQEFGKAILPISAHPNLMQPYQCSCETQQLCTHYPYYQHFEGSPCQLKNAGHASKQRVQMQRNSPRSYNKFTNTMQQLSNNNLNRNNGELNTNSNSNRMPQPFLQVKEKAQQSPYRNLSANTGTKRYPSIINRQVVDLQRP